MPAEEKKPEAAPAQDPRETLAESLPSEKAAAPQMADPDGDGRLAGDDEASEEGAAEEGEKAKAAPEKDAEEAPAVSDELTARAEAVGLSADDIKDLGTTATKTVALMEKQLLTLGGSTPESGQASGEKQPEAEKKPEGDDEIPDLSADDYDEPLVKVTTRMKATVKALSSELASLKAERAAERGEAFFSRFDHWVDSQNAPDVLGKGRGVELDANSAQYKNRLKVLETVQVLATGYQRTGRPVPQEDLLFKQAMTLALGEKVATENKEKATQARGRQMIFRPGSRSARAVPSGTRKAEDAVRNLLREKGEESA
jgi:hypothetical protein